MRVSKTLLLLLSVVNTGQYDDHLSEGHFDRDTHGCCWDLSSVRLHSWRHHCSKQVGFLMLLLAL